MRIIRGKYGRRRFDPPKNITARPTTDFARENIFNVIENIEDIEGSSVCDLFAGTGAIAFEFLSREAAEVTAVEMAQTQVNFIRSVKDKLGDDNIRIIKGDVFKFIKGTRRAYDIIFADPPYDHPRFEEIPSMVLESHLVKPGSLFIMEHSGNRDFYSLPGFFERREYGSVNFSLFRIQAASSPAEAPASAFSAESPQAQD
ncbi:MAG: RsmD family RNA methyltransferase [Muribaculaceae bacterium]|nr:RsmD family RNA methyltransferase [Muribaculaceae bacterium]